METKAALEKQGYQAEIHIWPHWSGGKFSPSQEAQKVSSEIGSEKVNIIAKSIGTFVFLDVLSRSLYQLEKVILCGLPVNDLSEEENKKYEYLDKLNSQQLTIFQNANDPHGNFEQVKKLISRINPEIKVVKKERSDHDYPFSEDFLAFLS